MKALLSDSRYDFISMQDKRFICDFTDKLHTLGYSFGDAIGPGFCWGRFMLIYTKANVKSKQVAARIYIREEDIVLRLFFTNVSRHEAYIRGAADHIQGAFTAPYGACTHCKGDDCRFRKDYTIGDVAYEKCNGRTFEFYRPTLARMQDYIGLFQEFYPLTIKRRA